IALGDIERYSLSSDLTSEEILEFMSTADMPELAVLELRYLLEQADLAKFAPQVVISPQDKPLIRLAVQWLRQVEQRNRSL
ncbi:MAG: hypothetical protein AAF125_05870, partial [Chloroflexota bacterium]